MIDRQSAGLLPAKPHTVLRDPAGNILYEEMHTRRGFDGPFTYLYHRYPVTAHTEVTMTKRGFPAPTADEGARFPIRRRLYLSDRIAPGGQALDRRTPVLFNDDLAISFTNVTESDDAYFANGDGDELWFIQDGSARLESSCGWLEVKRHDYVWVPKAMIHRWHLGAPGVDRAAPKGADAPSGMRAMIFESRGAVRVPDQFRNPVGQLRMDAPYTHRDFVHPTGPIATLDRAPEGPKELFMKRAGRFQRYALERTPMDVVGWDGFVYPFCFAIEKYQPKTGLIHLPPTIHATFAGPGYLVCSFVPRVTDTHPEAIPCPYPHSSVDCDEVILYLSGNFTSRRGVGPGAVSLHPSGIAHGPHPGAYEGSIGAKRSDELAVMVDTFAPLQPTAQAANIEDGAYHESWKTQRP